MRIAKVGLALAGAALLALVGCGGSGRDPILMNVKSETNGPDEFALLPVKTLELPEDLASLPEPTPGGTNRTDLRPNDDAIIALGGNPAKAGGIPAGDGGLYNYASRHGVTGGIRDTLAAEDLQFRRKNNGRLLERLLDVNVYFKAYRKMALDQDAELARWRRAGARTPSAPPASSK